MFLFMGHFWEPISWQVYYFLFGLAPKFAQQSSYQFSGFVSFSLWKLYTLGGLEVFFKSLVNVMKDVLGIFCTCDESLVKLFVSHRSAFPQLSVSLPSSPFV